MATKRGTKRKDKSRVVLKKGESQRKDIQSMLKHWKNFVSKKKL